MFTLICKVILIVVVIAVKRKWLKKKGKSIVSITQTCFWLINLDDSLAEMSLIEYPELVVGNEDVHH